MSVFQCCAVSFLLLAVGFDDPQNLCSCRFSSVDASVFHYVADMSVDWSDIVLTLRDKFGYRPMHFFVRVRNRL